MSKQIVLVTGGTGFVGSHVITLLLQQGYTVRATVRKASKLRALFPNAPTQLEVIELPSLVSDYTEAVKGVDALIHIASPSFFQGETGQEILEGAYHGTMNIVNTAIKGGVKKIVVTSTYVTLLEPDFKAAFGTQPVTAQSWGSVPFSSIDPVTETPMYVYITSKTAAERELWVIAKSNPTVDLTTIVPPVIFGPFVPHFANSTDRTALGTNDFVYTLLTGGPEGPNTYPPVILGHMVDVRDVAKAHVQALSASRVSGINKRLLISSGTFKWEATADLVRTARPELASRLPSKSAQAVMQTDAPMDVSLAAKIIGMSEDGYIRWEETILASIDAVVAWEKTVKA